MNIVDRIYQITRPAAIVALTGAAAATGAYSNPLRIVNDFGDLAVRDMATKARIADFIMSQVQTCFFADGKLTLRELYDLIISTNPELFTDHMINAMRDPERVSSIKPFANVLGIELSERYSLAFNGELASYGKFREALSRELYNRFVDTKRVTYKKWLNDIGFSPELTPDNPPYSSGLLRESLKVDLRDSPEFIDLSSSSLDEQLNIELGRVHNYFSSPQNQDAMRRRAEHVGSIQNRQYNGLAAGGLVAATLAAKSAVKRRRRSARGSK